MSDPKKTQLYKQASLSHIEQSLKIIPPPPQQAPITIYPGPKSQLANLSKADLEIADRLEKLKKKDEVPPTEEEMASRLAQLKGLPPDHYTKSQSAFYQAPDNRSNVEKSDDLLKQMMSEVSLEARLPKPEDEIEVRLARLRGETEGQPRPHQSLPAPSLELHSGETPSEQPLHCDEVEQLLKQAEMEALEATAAMKTLTSEPKVRTALAEAARRRRAKRTDSRSTSSEELMSASDEDETSTKAKGAEAKERAEVDRIVQLYTKKAEEKKKRRKARMKKEADAKTSSDELSSSSLSSSDNAVESTSEGERFSDMD